ncbi:MAG: hydrogenase maturation nickel metallochaperone HypA [Planctomycetes bacterium]|nr:hydrogenase maturation nickel metallochaperone HypA [Planctomycetota bacterium]
MHELSLAYSAIGEMQTILKKEGANKVNRIVFSVGALSGVDQEAFLFCFPLAAEGTPMEGVPLTMEDACLNLYCNSCNYEFINPEPIVICSKCQGVDVKVLSGQDFRIKEMEVE